MKPVVSSLVALIIAAVPMTALAKPHAHHKPHAAKVVKAEKTEKSEKPITKVKATKKPALHHASNVSMDGAGHSEPKVEHDKGEKAEKNSAIVPASMMTKAKNEKHVKPTKHELPKLPTPNAGKPSKGGAEKGAKKATEKKSEAGADANDGEPARDEELAELVARIRGISTEPASPSPAAPTAHAHVTKVSTAPCMKEPIEIIRGPEMERFSLTRCDGTVAPMAAEQLSILIRPGSAARPTTPLAELAKKPGADLAHGVKRVDLRLIERIQSVADHFAKSQVPAKVFVISGYRPASVGSMHSAGRAIDFRFEGVKNEDVVAFCKTLDDTGCGYYPNSSFVHMDVRDPKAGHVTWIDASGPGERPRYVQSWPPPSPLHRTSTADLAAEGEGILRATRPDADDVDEHPNLVSP